MSDAERQLEVLRSIESLVAGAPTPSALAVALESELRRRVAVDEAAVLSLEGSRSWLRRGAFGREDLSDELKALLQAAFEAGTAWEESGWGDVTVVPLSHRGERVGLLGVRKSGGFSAEQRRWLEFFEERAGVALGNAKTRALLEERNLELATIYEVDRIRDMHLPFQDMLQRIMERVLQLVPADGAALALANLRKNDDEVDALHVAGRPGHRDAVDRFLRDRVADVDAVIADSFRERTLVERPIGGPEPRDLICMPLILDEEVLGGFVLIGSAGHRLSARDKRLFTAVCSQTDTAIFEDVQRQRLKEVFKRYVSRDVFTEMLKRDEDFLAGRRRSVTCLFSDLRGFTAMSEKLDVNVVVDMLNEHLDAMCEVVFQHGGTVDKFIGDCVMAFFGAPLAQDDHAAQALRAACAMRSTHQAVAARWVERGLPDVRIGIGLHMGEVFVGNIGGEQLSSYTIIGDNVNLASRLEGESGPDEILVTSAAVDAARERLDLELEPRGNLTVRGKTIPVQLFQLISFRDRG